MSDPTPAGGDRAQVPAWPDILSSLLRREDLTAGTTAWAMDRIMSGEATGVQIAGFAEIGRAHV